MSLVSCHKQEVSGGMQNGGVIGFGGGRAIEEEAGSKAGYRAFGRDFMVFGTKHTAKDGSMTVFPWYSVRYTSGEYTYLYPGSEQSVKYWDPEATSYSFHAYSGVQAVTDGEKGTAAFGRLDAAKAQNVFYTGKQTIQKAQFDNEVVMVFERLGARVRFGFYETVPDVGVKDLEMKVSGNFVQSASYSFSADGIVSSEATGATKIDTPVLRGPLGKSSTEMTEQNAEHNGNITPWIAALPCADTALEIIVSKLIVTDDSDVSQTLELAESIKVNVPQEYCRWESNKEYTYIFKITNLQEEFNQIRFAFDRQIVKDWTDNGAEVIYDFIP